MFKSSNQKLKIIRVYKTFLKDSNDLTLYSILQNNF